MKMPGSPVSCLSVYVARCDRCRFNPFPTSSMRRLMTCSFALAALTAGPARAQDVAATDSARKLPPIARPASDSLFRRARRLVGEGSGVAGRALADSLLRTATEGTPAYGDALYWRGALAETAADAERDYRRVIVEYPLAYYADDALLAIAELEQARGDRAAALQHLQRFVREHPVSPARGVAALGAARLAFEQRDSRVGCAMVNEARASLTTGDVEIRNQLATYDGRCPPAPASRAAGASRGTPPAVPVAAQPTAAVAAPAIIPGAAPKAAPPRRAPVLPVRAPLTLRRDSSARATSRGRFTIQLAAYNTKADADRLVGRLATRGVQAHVSGTSKPFRVRLGDFGTQADAAAEVASLKARGIIGFVTTESPAAASAPPP